MNLIQQLQQTPKWEEFEEWYEKWRDSHKKNYHTFNIEVFKQYAPEIQKGVFEKFLTDNQSYIEVDLIKLVPLYNLWSIEDGYQEFDSFEELLLWYFNN